MNVLIVARTRMSGRQRCVGGLASNGRPLRLLTLQGAHWDVDSAYRVGQVWEMDLRPAPNLVAPHVEDVLVVRQRHLATRTNLRRILLQRVNPWRGGIARLFGGVLAYTASGNGYVSPHRGVPARSTGFWIPDHDLVLRSDRRHYDYAGGTQARGLAYVGEAEPVTRLPAGTLVRVSLARWWRPRDADPALEERCYAQISGWFA